MSASTLIRRAGALYKDLGIDHLAENGVFREHTRHYGMIVYPSIKSSREATDDELLEGLSEGAARLYVHIPFCTGRCTFCHFQLAGAQHTDGYMAALKDEIQLLAEKLSPVEFHGMFIGGGTPSLLPRNHMTGLLETVYGRLGVRRKSFNTLELHPEFVREPDARERLAEMKAMGINRVSIGVQSFEQDVLDAMNRRHTVEENYRAIEMVREVGFDFVDVDVMYALPSQRLEDWAHTLEEVVRLPVDSVSIFYLIIKRSTVMGRHHEAERLPLASERDAVLMHIMACERLREAGFLEAPTDHFHRAPRGQTTSVRHPNLLYSSFFVVPVGISGWGYMNHHHYWNTFDLQKYERMVAQGRLSVERTVRLDEDESLRRDIMFCLKYGGVNFPAFKERYGVDLDAEFDHVWSVLEDLELVRMDSEGAELTYRGRLFMEETCTFFFSPAVAGSLWSNSAGDSSRLLDTFHYMITPRSPERRKILAVIAHPDSKSYVHACLGAFREGARLAGHDLTELDLYELGYRSELSLEELRSARPPKDVLHHQELIEEADVLAFFFPIWWYSAPAILRGWIERSFTLNFAFAFSMEKRYVGLLGDKPALVVNVAGDRAESFVDGWGRAYYENQVVKSLETAGIERTCFRVFCDAHHRRDGERRHFLEEMTFLGMSVDMPVLYERSAAAGTAGERALARAAR